MACTEAVEELIGQHYNEQIRELIEDGEEKHREFLKVHNIYFERFLLQSANFYLKGVFEFQNC